MSLSFISALTIRSIVGTIISLLSRTWSYTQIRIYRPRVRRRRNSYWLKRCVHRRAPVNKTATEKPAQDTILQIRANTKDTVTEDAHGKYVPTKSRHVYPAFGFRFICVFRRQRSTWQQNGNRGRTRQIQAENHGMDISYLISVYPFHLYEAIDFR